MRLLLALALLPGCAAVGLACTEMGCSGTLTIFVDGALPDGATVEVILGDVAEACAVADENWGGCSIAADGATIAVGTGMGEPPGEVTVVITPVDSAATEHTLEPDWGDSHYPNGKACDGPDGGCVSGEVDLVL